MYLGIIWWVLEPLMYVLVFYIVFGVGFRQASENYVPWLLCGLIVWKWFDSSARTAAGTIAQSVGIMSQVYLPKIVFPMITVLTNCLKFFIILAVYLLFIHFYGVPAQTSWFWLLVVIPLQLLLVAGVAALFAGLVPILPDLSHAINYGMTFLFFGSGIFFNVKDMSPKGQYLMKLNPASCLIETYRGVLLRGERPSVIALGCVVAWTLLFAAAALLLHRKMDRVYPRLVG